MGIEGYSKQDLSAITPSFAVDIPFYLPISRTQFPELSQKLELALAQASEEDSNLNGLKLTTTDYWHPYQHGIRQGRHGIYFAAPHFTSWLVNQHNFEPTLRLSGELQYVIATRRSDSHIFEISDLANKNVCTSATMDLGFLVVRDSMKASLLPATIERVRAVDIEMKENNKDCDAFSLSEHQFLEFAAQDPFKFIRLQQSQRFSNYAYVLHPGISSKTKRALGEFLVSKRATEILRPMYRLFTKEPIILSAESSHYPPSQMQLLQPYWGADLGLLKDP